MNWRMIARTNQGDGTLALELHPGRTVVRDALTVFPVWSGAPLTSRGYDLSSADLTVEDRIVDAADEFVVTNNGRRAAMVLKGDLLEGGQQVRVAARPMLIQPGETQVLWWTHFDKRHANVLHSGGGEFRDAVRVLIRGITHGVE